MDTASTSDAVNFITYVQTLKRKIKQFEKNVDVSNCREQKHSFQPQQILRKILISYSFLESLVVPQWTALAGEAEIPVPSFLAVH